MSNSIQNFRGVKLGWSPLKLSSASSRPQHALAELSLSSYHIIITHASFISL